MLSLLRVWRMAGFTYRLEPFGKRYLLAAADELGILGLRCVGQNL